MTEGTMVIDPTKPVQTRNGYPATIVDPDFNGGLLTVIDMGGRKEYRVYCPEGKDSFFVKGGRDHYTDLINVPEKYVWWVNFYPQDHPAAHQTRQTADALATDARVACIRVEFEEGEGLE